MNVNITTHQLTNQVIVTFHHAEIEGMVGETYYNTKAYITDFKELLSEEIDYEQAKALYNQNMKNFPKRDRIAFWRDMKTMSPEAVEEQRLISFEEAKNRIR